MKSAQIAFAKQFYDPREIENLPLPVRRYFLNALQEGQAMISRVRFKQQGEFRQNEKSATWQPFHATQCVTTNPPGFDWDARIRMAPGIDVWVRDAYVVGGGSLRAAIFGFFTVAEQSNTEASSRGELMRYLAEAAWYPTALLPNQGIRWDTIDDSSARATISDGTITISLNFTFGVDGLITSVWTESRPRTSTDSSPWTCHYHGYEDQAGMRVPITGEVEWELSGEPAPYLKGRMTHIEYEY
ncbi:DUF6920 family protein [Undibacterium sp. Rencai35W]